METNYNIHSGKRITGQKVYTYDENINDIVIYRVVSFKESANKYKTYNLNTDKIEWIEADKLEDTEKFIILNPTGFLTFIIANMNATNNIKDVLVCLHKRDQLKNETPYAVCRQCIQDIFVENTVLKKSNYDMVGCSISIDTCPPNVPFETVLTYENAKWMTITAVYLDDSLESINKYILAGINVKKYNNVLNETKEWAKTNQPTAKGFSESVYDLLKDNKFMYDFRRAFKIYELDFDINENKDIETGYQLSLTPEQLESFNKLLLDINNDKAIMTLIIPYDETIDVNDINRNHILCKGKNSDKIFIITYDVLM